MVKLFESNLFFIGPFPLTDCLYEIVMIQNVLLGLQLHGDLIIRDLLSDVNTCKYLGFQISGLSYMYFLRKRKEIVECEYIIK